MLIIGTRGSKLALIQSEIVAAMLRAAGESVEIRTITTSGDKTDKPLADEGGKGLFVKEIEEALLSGEIDIAVHSLKDMPGEIPPGLELAAFPPREDARDVFVSTKFDKLDDLPAGARVGTSSPRRQAQLQDLRPDLNPVPIRGNVDTRIEKLEAGECDAIILAAAGLVRLGRQSEIKEYLSIDKMIPSVGQGALAIEVRKGEKDLINKLRKICHHEETATSVRAERAFLQAIGGDCYTPLAAHAMVNGERINMISYLANSERGFTEQIEGPVSEAESLGKQLAEHLLKIIFYSSSERQRVEK